MPNRSSSSESPATSAAPIDSSTPVAAATPKTAVTVAIAGDHASVALKGLIGDHLRARGFGVLDLGTHGSESVDYPDFADAVAEAITSGQASRGVLICGTGIGIAIAANRYCGVRAAVCHDATTARLARAHNDANVLSLGARIIGPEVALDSVMAFLETAFEGSPRHQRRIAKLERPRDT